MLVLVKILFSFESKGYGWYTKPRHFDWDFCLIEVFDHFNEDIVLLSLREISELSLISKHVLKFKNMF